MLRRFRSESPEERESRDEREPRSDEPRELRRLFELVDPLLAEVLEDIAGYLTGLAEYTGSRAKQVVWVVTSHGGAAAAPRSPSSRSLTTLLGRGTPAHGVPSAAQRSALALVVERARRLADSLAQLGGVPPARLMEAEEIARLLYQRADPVRAGRYPLSGTLLGRVRRVVTTDERSTR